MPVPVTRPVRSKRNAHEAQDKFVATRKEMNDTLIERQKEIDLCLTGLIAQQHVLLVGPPGTAKSMIAQSIAKWTSARDLTVQCCKDTTRNVAFGPIKVSKLLQDITERNLIGGAADVEFLVLEEVFKSGPAVLDMFLMVMNERVYREGLVQYDTPLRFLLGVSNEWSPEGCEAALSAFFDRFLLRSSVSTIRTEKGMERLLAIPVAGQIIDRSHIPQLSTSLSLEEVDLAHEEAIQLQFTPEAIRNFNKIRVELNKQGICPGDRRLKQSVGAVQAYAWLSGASVVESEHLEILSAILWIDPTEQEAKCRKIVAEISNPVGTMINGILTKVEDIIAKETAPRETVEKLDACLAELDKIRSDPRKDEATDYISTQRKLAAYRAAGLKV